MARDKFSPSTRETIAKRAGFLCSFPGCGNITTSPSSNSSKSSNTGMACHISAASPGKNAKRYNFNLSPDQRSHPDNGIWMCYKHGKIIDNDESRYTEDILHHWKDLAKDVVTYMHEHGVEYSKALKIKEKSPIAINKFEITSIENENEIIGDALLDSCIHISWGKSLMNTIRDFLIEYTRNTFKHGDASSVKFEFKDQKLTICDNGDAFNIQTLSKMKSGRGGQLAYDDLIKKYGSNIVLTCIRKRKNNYLTISLLSTPKQIFNVTKCAIEISRQEFRYGVDVYNIDENCQELFIVLPKYLTPSDVQRVKENALDNEHRPLVFIGEHLSDLAIRMVKEKYPESKLINLN